MSVFSNRLKEARVKKGRSQEQLGLDAGLDPMSASTRMNRYELAEDARLFFSGEVCRSTRCSAALFLFQR